jgi:hypothetical protein
MAFIASRRGGGDGADTTKLAEAAYQRGERLERPLEASNLRAMLRLARDATRIIERRQAR